MSTELTQVMLSNATTTELLRMVDRKHPEVNELAMRLETLISGIDDLIDQWMVERGA